MQAPERRQDYRLNTEVTILLELMSSSYDGQSPSEVLICHSIDISASGLQIAVNQPLEPGLILNLSVQLEGALPIYLVTEVKWQFQVKFGGEWLTGMEVLESQGAGIADWKRLVARRLREN